MADFMDHISDKHAAFIAEQPMFFTASACATGRINLSPKSNDSFRVFSPTLVGFLDLGGSGNETAAHLKHDGRVTIMFNSFTRNPLIYRIYGRGRFLRPQHPDYAEYIDHFPQDAISRQIILVDVESTQSSCGYGVPMADNMIARDTLKKWAENKGEEKVKQYQQDNNLVSIDGFDTGLND